MGEKQKKKMLYGFVLLLLTTIVGYNIWSFDYGYCTVRSLMSISFPAILLIVGIVFAVAWLMTMKSRGTRMLSQNRCVCGAELRDQWLYCPDCGRQQR